MISKWVLLFFATASALSATAQSTPPARAPDANAQEPPPIALPEVRLENGQRVSVTLDPSDLRWHKRDYDLDVSGQGSAGSAQITTAACIHGLSLNRLSAELVKRINEKQIKVAYHWLGSDQLIIVTRPVPYAGSFVRFYYYSAEMTECVSSCRLSVETNRITAEIDHGSPLLSSAKHEDDDVTDDLDRAAEDEFTRCKN